MRLLFFAMILCKEWLSETHAESPLIEQLAWQEKQRYRAVQQTVRMLCLRNRRKGHPFCRPQSENGIVTPPLPLNAVVAQRGASWGIYQREKNRTNLRCGSRSARPASIAVGIPLAAETGEPVPLSGLQTGYQMSRGENKKISRWKSVC